MVLYLHIDCSSSLAAQHRYRSRLRKVFLVNPRVPFSESRLQTFTKKSSSVSSQHHERRSRRHRLTAEYHGISRLGSRGGRANTGSSFSTRSGIQIFVTMRTRVSERLPRLRYGYFRVSKSSHSAACHDQRESYLAHLVACARHEMCLDVILRHRTL